MSRGFVGLSFALSPRFRHLQVRYFLDCLSLVCLRAPRSFAVSQAQRISGDSSGIYCRSIGPDIASPRPGDRISSFTSRG